MGLMESILSLYEVISTFEGQFNIVGNLFLFLRANFWPYFGTLESAFSLLDSMLCHYKSILGHWKLLETNLIICESNLGLQHTGWLVEVNGIY